MKNDEKVQVSKYVLKIRIYDKSGKFLTELYTTPCSVIVDEPILSMYRKITYALHMLSSSTEDSSLSIYSNIDHTMIYVYTSTNFNIACTSSITTPNILNEMIEETTLSVSKHNLSDPVYSQFDYVGSAPIDIYVTTVIDEVEIIKNFYFGKIDDRLISDLYYNYISVYFPILDFQIYKNLFVSSLVKRNVNIDVSYINKMQQEIELIEHIAVDDVEFLHESELKNVFLIFTPNFTSVHIPAIDKLMKNMIFLDDIFLSIFENISVDDVDSIILQTPQIVCQKGVLSSRGDDLHTAPYRLTLKGRWYYDDDARSRPDTRTREKPKLAVDRRLSSFKSIFSENIFGKSSLSQSQGSSALSKNNYKNKNRLPISYTLDFEAERCRAYLSYSGLMTNAFTSKNIENFLYYITHDILSTADLIQVTYLKYTVDFFNVKVPIKRALSIPSITEVVKKLGEYFFVSKESTKSIYMKYRIGHMHNVLSGLYNKLFAILNASNGDLSQEKFLQLRVEYQLENDELLAIVNDVRMKVNSSYRERGVSILVSDSFINISGLNSIYMNDRILFVINRVINIATSDKRLATLKPTKYKIRNEYMQYVTHLDTFIKNKIDAYWCKACQDYANKIRKPIQYDRIPGDFKYDAATNTHVNSQGYRILTLQMDDGERVHMGCDMRRSNPNKYIGFIKTCSLCCFQEDQFTSKSGMSQKKVVSCWTKNKRIRESSTPTESAYVYTNAKMIGDVCLVPAEFSNYFNENDYLFKLISVGSANIQPRPNELVFVGSQLINPQMYMYDSEPYSIYIYDNPFTYKLISRYDHSIDSFAHTRIDDFILSCRRAFNAFAPLNAYNILIKHKNQIDKFSYIEDMNTCIFINSKANGLVFAFIDRTLAFGEYTHMFGSNVRYVNSYSIPKLTDILDYISRYEVESLLINTNGEIIGFSVHTSFFILFKTCKVSEFHLITSNKYSNFKNTTNVAIASLVNQEMKLSTSGMLITPEIAESYIYKLFRYHLYVYFNLNPRVKSELINLSSKEASARLRREKIRHILYERIARELFIVDDKPIKYEKIEISNNISRTALSCKYPGEIVNDYARIKSETLTADSSKGRCKLRVPRDMQARMLDSVVNELIFPYSSIYVYTSQFINNTYSPFSVLVNRLHDKSASMSTYMNDQSMRILNDGRLFVQEICPFDAIGAGANITIYRALANIYFWNSTRDEVNVNRRNLGYYSQSQTYLAYYIQSVVKLPTNEIVHILNIFYVKFKIDVSLQVDSSIIRRLENENSEFHIYMSLNNGTVSSISVGFDLVDVAS